jgi:hypothetical protein
MARSEEDRWRGDGSLKGACSVAESTEEGGSDKDGKAEDKGRTETDSNSFSSFRCNAVRNCCQLSSVALYIPMSI